MTDLETDQEDNLDTNTSETPETADEADEDNSQEEEQEEATETVDQAELRRQQQKEGSKKEVEKYKSIAFETAIEAAAANGSSLLRLHEKDPKLAEKVARHFKYESFAAAKSYLESLEKGEEEAPSTMTEDQFEKMYEKRRKEEVHQESLKKAEKLISKIGDDDKRERAEAFFEKMVGNKRLTEDEALEYAEAATLYVSKDAFKSSKKEDAIGKLASTGLSTSKKGSKDDLVEAVDWETGKTIFIPNKLK